MRVSTASTHCATSSACAEARWPPPVSEMSMSTFFLLLRSLLEGTTGEGDSRRAAVAVTSTKRRAWRSIFSV